VLQSNQHPLLEYLASSEEEGSVLSKSSIIFYLE